MSQVPTGPASGPGEADPNVAFLRELAPAPTETAVRKRVIAALLRDVVHGRDPGR